MARAPLNSVRRIGFLIGALLALAALVLLVLPSANAWLSKGPANSGHADTACDACHVSAPGTFRQQVQGKLHFWVGLRETNTAFGHKPVDNRDCVSCHARESDDHPVDRFAEERFVPARRAFAAHTCAGCHTEHTGRRVTMPATGCQHCHDRLTLKKDPLDVPHSKLVADKNWTSCLGCHDFHGNVVREVPTRLKDALTPDVVEAYLAGGPPIYGTERRFKAKGQRP